MRGHGSHSLSIAAIAAALAGLGLEVAGLAIFTDPMRTFVVAVLAGYAVMMTGRAVAWRIRGE